MPWPIRRSKLTTVRTQESPPYHPTSKMTILIINSRSFIWASRAGTRHYAPEGFHCQRNGAVLILSLHALCFQIPEIDLWQWHHHCSNAKSHPSSTNHPNLTVHHPPRHWCFPTNPVETTIFHNPRPGVIRTFPNTKRALLRWRKGSWRQFSSPRILGENIRWQVLDGWRSLETSDWSPGSSEGISRCTCTYTICVSIAWWSISQNRSANTRSCKSWILFNASLSDLWILTTPKNIHSWNWRLVQFKDGWQMGHVELLSEVTSWMWALRLSFRSRLWSSCLMMHTSPRSAMIRSHGSRKWKCLISFCTNFSSPPIAWGASQQHPSISNLLLLRH